MRILRAVTLGSNSGKYGGPWSTSLRQAELARNVGHDVRLAFGYLPGDAPLTQHGQHAAPVRRVLPLPGYSGLLGFRAGVEALRGVRWAQVVHISLARDLFPLLVGLLAVAFRRRLIVQTHGMVRTTHGRFARVADPLIRHVMRRAEVTIALTDTEKKQLREWGFSGAVVVIGNSVPDNLVDATIPRAPNPHEVLFMARLHARKRAHVFAAAATISRSAGRWVIVGPDGGQLLAIQQYLATHGGATYDGHVAPEAVYDRVAACSVFVLPADAEPWGNLLVAALALGRPVVVTASTALATAITQCSAGRVVPDDDPVTMAAAVDQLLSDEAEYARCARNAKAFARENLSDRVLADRLLSLYA